MGGCAGVGCGRRAECRLRAARRGRREAPGAALCPCPSTHRDALLAHAQRSSTHWRGSVVRRTGCTAWGPGRGRGRTRGRAARARGGGRGTSVVRSGRRRSAAGPLQVDRTGGGGGGRLSNRSSAICSRRGAQWFCSAPSADVRGGTLAAKGWGGHGRGTACSSVDEERRAAPPVGVSCAPPLNSR